jgi:hypothetical protein
MCPGSRGLASSFGAQSAWSCGQSHATPWHGISVVSTVSRRFVQQRLCDSNPPLGPGEETRFYAPAPPAEKYDLTQAFQIFDRGG